MVCPQTDEPTVPQQIRHELQAETRPERVRDDVANKGFVDAGVLHPREGRPFGAQELAAGDVDVAVVVDVTNGRKRRQPGPKACGVCEDAAALPAVPGEFGLASIPGCTATLSDGDKVDDAVTVGLGQAESGTIDRAALRAEVLLVFGLDCPL